jgi:hypothetical protein
MAKKTETDNTLPAGDDTLEATLPAGADTISAADPETVAGGDDTMPVPADVIAMGVRIGAYPPAMMGSLAAELIDDGIMHVEETDGAFIVTIHGVATKPAASVVTALTNWGNGARRAALMLA